MAVPKLTRSPRRAQLHSTPDLSKIARRLPKPVERLAVYENLHALNRDFGQVLADLARLQELGVFQHDRFNIFRIMVQETRAWANMELAELLQMREEDDLGWFGRLHRRCTRPNQARSSCSRICRSSASSMLAQARVSCTTTRKMLPRSCWNTPSSCSRARSARTCPKSRFKA